MEGYLWKSRFFDCTNGKKVCLRQRYVILDEDNEVLCFKTKKEEENVHKVVPLCEFKLVEEYGDHGFLLTTRHVATHEVSGAKFLFRVEEEGIFEGLCQADTRDLWVEKLRGKINSANDGLDLVMRNSESVHGRYNILVQGPHSVLGSGMSGDVRLVYRRTDNKPFALKTISLTNISGAKLGALRREIDIMKSLDHPHIARLQETYIDPKLSCRLIIELCEGGELYRRLSARNHFPERYAGKLLTTMLKALNYLHFNHIVHRDLKLENWLFRNKEGFKPCEHAENGEIVEACGCDVCEDADVALIDFGLSRRYRSDDEKMMKQVGTSYYIAPEVIKKEYYGVSCDMWSLGVIAFMLLSGHAPFDADKDSDILELVLNGELPDIMSVTDSNSVWTGISDSCKDFVMCLLKRDPVERLTTRQALDHPYISQFLHGNDSEEVHDEEDQHLIAVEVLERLRNFAKYKELKRLAMEVIAFSLSHSDIKDLTDLFEEIDTDNDGYIEYDELVSALEDNDQIDESEIREIFNALDEENNGRVHVNEFVAGALQARYHLEDNYLYEAFSRMDVDHKGKVTLNDLQRLLGKCGNQARIEKIWEQSGLAEKSKTEDITFEKFMEFMRTDGESQVINFASASSNQSVDSTGHPSAIDALKSRLNISANTTSNSSEHTESSRIGTIEKMRRLFKRRGKKKNDD